VDAGFYENEAELGVLVLSVALKMLADGNSLLDQHVEVLWDLWREAIRLEDAENLVTSDNLDLRNTVRVPEDNTDLRGSCTLLGELADLVDDLLGGGLEPGGRGARVGDGAGGYTLSVAVKTTHDGGCCGVERRLVVLSQAGGVRE